jgi:hypothetical protein
MTDDRGKLAGTLLLLGALVALPGLGQPAPPVQSPPPTQGPQPQGAAAAQPEVAPLGDDRFRIGQVVLDRVKREVRFPGAVTLHEGTLEYLACAPSGKLYESLLRADVDPYHLQLALLLIGLEPRNNLRRQGDEATPLGDPLTIHVAWETAGGRVERRAESLVRQHYASDKTMTETEWVFTGSLFHDGVFAASVNRSLIAVYNDPTAIVNNPQRGGSDDTFYVPNASALPALGTVVEIILRAVPERGAK